MLDGRAAVLTPAESEKFSEIFLGSWKADGYDFDTMSNPMVDSLVVQRCLCHFSGRVQGVGFRYTAKNIAMRHNVTGYVKNLSDGRVELVLEGPEQEIQSVLDSVTERMAGYIHQVNQAHTPPTGEYAHFHIRHC
jgi:acylphosphatase